jgi:hypothetical protein
MSANRRLTEPRETAPLPRLSSEGNRDHERPGGTKPRVDTASRFIEGNIPILGPRVAASRRAQLGSATIKVEDPDKALRELGGLLGFDLIA